MSNTKAMLLRYNKGVTWKTINNADNDLYFRTTLNIIKIFKILNQLLWSHHILVTSCQVLFLTSKISLYFNYYALLKKKLGRVPSIEYNLLDGRLKRGAKKNRLYSRLLKSKALHRAYRRLVFLTKGVPTSTCTMLPQTLDALQALAMATYMSNSGGKKLAGKFARLTKRRIKIKKKYKYLVQNRESSTVNISPQINTKSAALVVTSRKAVNLSMTFLALKKEGRESPVNSHVKTNKTTSTGKSIIHSKSSKFNKATPKDKEKNRMRGKILKHSTAKIKATKNTPRGCESIRRTKDNLKFGWFNTLTPNVSIMLGYRKSATVLQKPTKRLNAKKRKRNPLAVQLAYLSRIWLKNTPLKLHSVRASNKQSISVSQLSKRLGLVKTKCNKKTALGKTLQWQLSYKFPKSYNVGRLLKKRYLFFALGCVLSRLVKKSTLLCPAPVLSIGSESLLSYYRNRVDAAIPFFLKKLFFHKDLINTIVCTSLLRNSYLLSFFLARLMEKIPRHTWFFNALNRYVSVFRFYCNAPISLKIIIKGRVNRKLRKKSVCVLKTQVALSRMQSAVDYSLTHSFTRASVLGVKVWVVSNSRASKVKTFDQKYKTY